MYNPKTLEHLAREKIELDDKSSAEIMINPSTLLTKIQK